MRSCMRKGLIGLCICMILSCTSCRQTDSAETPSDDGKKGSYTWHDAVSTLATNWNPHTYEGVDDAYPQSFIRSGLYTFLYNDALHPVEGKEPYESYVVLPEMAAALPVDVTQMVRERYPQYDIPAQATSGYAYQIDLNPLATWENGVPITAETYISSMQRLLDPKLLNYRATDYYDGEFAIAGAKNYAYSGRTVKRVNSSDGETADFPFSGLQKGSDGIYTTPDGGKVYVGLDESGYGRIEGQKLSALAGDFPEGVYDALRGMADDRGYVPANDQALELLYAYVAKTEAFATRDDLGFYLSYDYTHPTAPWSDVGLFASGEHQITLVLEKALSGFHLLYNLTGNWLVYDELYDACIRSVGSTYQSYYHTSVDTTLSYGPYRLVSYQADKAMRFERNETWYGYRDGRHVYRDPISGEDYPMYQTTAIDCSVVAEAETRKLMFLKGQLMTYALGADDYDTYRFSEYGYATPGTSTFFLILNGHTGAIAAREASADFDRTATDLECLTLPDFRRGIALSYDRDLFARTVSPARSGGYGLIGTSYIYDPDTMTRYRDSDAARRALCQFYAVDTNAYVSLDAAENAITGYDVEGARQCFRNAFAEGIRRGYITDLDGDGRADQTVRIEYCVSADSDFMTTTINYLNSALSEVLEGTPFEGRVVFYKSAPYGNQWFNRLKSGLSDTVLGGWSGSALDPFSLSDLYTNPARAYDAGWFSADTVPLSLTVNGESITMSLRNWSNALNGTTVQVGDSFYNFGTGQVDTETRLSILAAIETGILSTYNYIPMLQDASMTLLSKQVYYVVEDYHPVMERGGLAYARYNYDDAAWRSYVISVGGELNY